jgi:hypothetical protein
MSLFQNSRRLSAVFLVSTLGSPLCVFSGSLQAEPSEKATNAFAHWTKEKRAAAIPRDLVIDTRGLGYLRQPDGKLEPYGHSVAAMVRDQVRGKPDNSDSTPPTIKNMVPSPGSTIGESHAFSADITDDSGVGAVSFRVQYPSGLEQSFTPSKAGDNYSILFSGFSDGDWNWQVSARDNTKKGGNSVTTNWSPFTVSTNPTIEPPGTGDSGDSIANARWGTGGNIQFAAGRIYFEMPNNPRKKRWSGYVCSGTVVTDTATDRSIILTAAHCVYDDANQSFARRVIFIPNQDGSSRGTDTDCSNDPIGCWAVDFGVVDENWTLNVFPNNIEWDYAYYVVAGSGAHTPGQESGTDEALDGAVTPMGITFAPQNTGNYTYALGYSYSEDPNFMYCAENMSQESQVNWWLGNCELSGGSSGGPWVQSDDNDLDTDNVMSVNSWGYTDRPGMAGPLLEGNSAACLFDKANSTPLENGGVIVTGPDCTSP